MIRTLLKLVQDILAPKPAEVRTLECMSADKLSATLPPADQSADRCALFAYRDSRVKNLVWEIKYRKNVAIANTVGQLLYEKMAMQAHIDKIVGTKILLVPIASSKKRRRERGFNQCEVMCEAILKFDTQNILAYAPEVLEKCKNTPHQADLPREERLKNIIGSYIAREPEKIRDATIYLVDDVVTTGATMKEAAHVLVAAGAKAVHGFAIAH